MSEFVCIYCKKEFKSKSSHKTHIETNKTCIKNRPDKSQYILQECACSYQSYNKHDFQRHLSKCKDACKHLSEEVLRLKSFIEEKDKELLRLKQISEEVLRLKSVVDEKDKQIEYFREMMDKAISKPTSTSITTNSNSSIKNNNNILNILSDTYEEQTLSDRVEAIARKSIQKYFWQGQKGIANFCVDHIIKSQDGKMIICCTDPARKKFKYLKQDQMIDDLDARMFTDKISVPIKNVCREVYDNIMKKIDEEREEKTDAFDLNALDTKTSIAQEKFLEITNLNDHQKNSEYKTELSILLKQT
jgi:hypothetical protein